MLKFKHYKRWGLLLTYVSYSVSGKPNKQDIFTNSNKHKTKIHILTEVRKLFKNSIPDMPTPWWCVTNMIAWQSFRQNENCNWSHLLLVEFRLFVFFLGGTAPQWARASSFTRFLDHTQRRTTVGRTPLDDWSARRSDLYLTTHNTHNRQTSMPPVGIEPTISTGERPQTYALDRAATGSRL